MLLLLVAAAACDDMPQEPEEPGPEPDLTAIIREWYITRVVNGELFAEDTVESDTAGTGEEVDVTEILGTMVIYPPDQGPDAEGDVYSSETGFTYWVGAQAPIEVLDSGSTIGGGAELTQYQTFRKTEENATLSYVVSETQLELLDDIAALPTPEECPWQTGLAPIEVECADVMSATVGFEIEAARYIFDDRGDVDSVDVFYRVQGFARWDGFRPVFSYNATTAVSSLGPFWDRSDFDSIPDPTSAERGGRIVLRQPITIVIPLDSLAVEEVFDVVTNVKALAVTRRQRESYASAYFRDPLKAAGLSHAYGGIEPIQPFDARPTPVEPAPCEDGATPPAGTIQFAADEYGAPEQPGVPAWIAIRRTGGSTGRAAARLVTSDGSATAGEDYEALDTYVLFADGEEGERVAQIPILADAEIESDETVELALEAVPGCGSLGAPSTATLTIRDDDDPIEIPTFTVGGTVTGLEGEGLILTNVSTDDLAITADGPFVFDREYPDGIPYIVRVDTQPTTPIQSCTVTNGEGDIMGADVTNIEVTCVTPPPADDDLDPDFGEGGKVTEGSIPGVEDMGLQADGKVVVVGGNVVARYDTDGSLDPTFGTGGEVTVVFNDASDEVRAVAIQPDGMIVVAGRADDPAGVTDLDMAVARFDASGNLDAGFGTGGVTLADFTGEGEEANDVVIQPDGSIVVVGTAAVADSFGIVGGDFGVLRLTSAGQPDAGFGANGRVTTNIAGSTDLAYAVALQADGKILVSGRVANSGGENPDIGIARYEADGTPDAGFGDMGIVRHVTSDTWDEVAEMAVQPDGNIVVAGRFQTQSDPFAFMVARFDPAGDLDLTFGGTGIVTDAFSADNDFAEAMALQPDGKIVVVGQVGNLSGNPDFAIERFNADGTLDTDFGTDGRLTVDFFIAVDAATAVVVQADGKIVVAGSARNGASTGVGMVRVVP